LWFNISTYTCTCCEIEISFDHKIYKSALLIISNIKIKFKNKLFSLYQSIIIVSLFVLCTFILEFSWIFMITYRAPLTKLYISEISDKNSVKTHKNVKKRKNRNRIALRNNLQKLKNCRKAKKLIGITTCVFKLYFFLTFFFENLFYWSANQKPFRIFTG